MSDRPQILVFAGSARRAALSKKLASAAADAVGRSGGAPTLVDLADYPAPIYNADDEAERGVPPRITDFKRLLARHDGLFIVTPEYNSGLTPLIVNVFTWCSSVQPDETVFFATSGKPVAIAASSPGRLGGIRVLPRLRDFLSGHQCMILPGMVAVPEANKAFDESGALVAEPAAAQIADLARTLVDIARTGQH